MGYLVLPVVNHIMPELEFVNALLEVFLSDDVGCSYVHKAAANRAFLFCPHDWDNFKVVLKTETACSVELVVVKVSFALRKLRV